MNKIAFIALSFFASASLAYQEGTFTCQSGVEGVPARTVKIQGVSLQEGVTLPYVEITRSYRKVPGNPDSGIETTTQKGFASLSTSGDREIMVLAATRLDFLNGELQNCKP